MGSGVHKGIAFDAKKTTIAGPEPSLPVLFIDLKWIFATRGPISPVGEANELVSVLAGKTQFVPLDAATPLWSPLDCEGVPLPA